MQKIHVDLTRQLSPSTHAAILSFLETLPLGQVYGLFQSIINELTQVPIPDARTDSCRPGSAPPGSGDSDQRDNRIPPMETQQGGGGVESGDKGDPRNPLSTS